jgi:hypothetical protein
MTDMSFDALTRRAAATITRRRSLLALSAATVGAAALPGSVRAGRCTNTCNKKLEHKCKQQAAQCVEAVEGVCGQVSNPTTRQQCLDSCLPACDPEGDCLNRGNYASLVQCAIFL